MSTTIAVVAAGAAKRTRSSNYPEPFAFMRSGRIKQPLGDPFGLKNFGVNRTTIAPGDGRRFAAHKNGDPY